MPRRAFGPDPVGDNELHASEPAVRLSLNVSPAKEFTPVAPCVMSIVFSPASIAYAACLRAEGAVPDGVIEDQAPFSPPEKERALISFKKLEPSSPPKITIRSLV